MMRFSKDTTSLNTNKEELEMKNTNNTAMTLNTNKEEEKMERIPTELEFMQALINYATKEEEELTMTNTNKVSTELELMEQLMNALNNNPKEETIMITDYNKDLLAVKGLVIAVNKLANSQLLGEAQSKLLSATVKEVADGIKNIEKELRVVSNLKQRVTKRLAKEVYDTVIYKGGSNQVFYKIWNTVTSIANQYYVKKREEERQVDILLDELEHLVMFGVEEQFEGGVEKEIRRIEESLAELGEVVS